MRRGAQQPYGEGDGERGPGVGERGCGLAFQVAGEGTFCGVRVRGAGVWGRGEEGTW